MKKTNNIIILVGASSVGKDSIARILEQEYGYNFIISTTSRPIRPGESEKNPYYFVTKEEFEKRISDNKMIEYRTYNTLVDNVPAIWYYGAEKTEVENDKSYVVVLDIIGLKEFKEIFGDRVVSFFINVDDEIRKQRCMSRGDFNESEWNRRLIDDKRVFADDVINENVNFKVDNYDINEAVKVIIDLISKQ